MPRRAISRSAIRLRRLGRPVSESVRAASRRRSCDVRKLLSAKPRRRSAAAAIAISSRPNSLSIVPGPAVALATTIQSLALFGLFSMCCSTLCLPPMSIVVSPKALPAIEAIWAKRLSLGRAQLGLHSGRLG